MQRTLVTIPNATVMAAKVVNNQARDRFLFNPVIGLTYGTTADQMALVLDDIRRMLAADRRVHPEGQRVRFRAFGPSALDVEILAWIETTDVYEYWAVVEELNFSLLSIVEGAGASFAYPTQQMYVARAPQPDPARLAAARVEMERRRAERQPEPDDEPPAGE